MSNKILKIIELLSEVDARDLDALDVESLAQFYYWLVKHQGAIFVKSVGRLGRRVETNKSLHSDGTGSGDSALCPECGKLYCDHTIA